MELSKYTFIGVCNPVIDGTIELDPAVIDENCRLAGIKQGGATDVSGRPELVKHFQAYLDRSVMSAGGSVANTMKSISGFSNKQMDCIILTNYDDTTEAGKVLEESSAEYGAILDRSGFKDALKKSPRCLVMIDKITGQRTFVYLDGWPVPGYSAEELIDKLRLLIATGRFNPEDGRTTIIFEGFAVDSTQPQNPLKIYDIVSVCRSIKAISSKIMINVSPSLAAPWQITKDQMITLYKEHLIDSVSLDEDQAVMYNVKPDGLDVSIFHDLEKLREIIIPAPGIEFTITRGAKPTISIDKNGVIKAHPVPKIPNIVNSNGAGDTYASAQLVYCLVTGDFDRSVDVGNEVATVKVTVNCTILPMKELVDMHLRYLGSYN